MRLVNFDCKRRCIRDRISEFNDRNSIIRKKSSRFCFKLCCILLEILACGANKPCKLIDWRQWSRKLRLKIYLILIISFFHTIMIHSHFLKILIQEFYVKIFICTFVYIYIYLSAKIILFISRSNVRSDFMNSLVKLILA